MTLIENFNEISEKDEPGEVISAIQSILERVYVIREDGKEKVKIFIKGVFMFPNQRAAEIAVETVLGHLDETGSGMKVLFNVFKDQDLEIYRRLVDKG